MRFILALTLALSLLLGGASAQTIGPAPSSASVEASGGSASTLRGRNIAAGTSTTGTGTLTLAALPAVLGGIDINGYLKARGFVAGNAFSQPYELIEFTDTTYVTISKIEKGWGTVTLGAAIANATLSRDTILFTQSSGTYSDQAPTAISIGTAANVLVFFDLSAVDLIATNPYYDTSLSAANAGIWAGLTVAGLNAQVNLGTDGTGSDWYWKFTLPKPLYVKRATLSISGQAYTGTTGSPVSTAYGRIYQVNSSGQPGKKLLDLGTFGTNPLNTAGVLIQTGAASPGLFLPAGEYFFDLFATFTGATGSVTTPILNSWTGSPPLAITAGIVIKAMAFATGGSSTASDPANVTGYGVTGIAINNTAPQLWLNNN